jgi:alpha-glucosidase (family GH31 glycosyl hydrolase)
MRWQDGCYYKGPVCLDLWVSLEEIPIFIRTGAVIPMQSLPSSPQSRLPVPSSTPVEFHCFGGTEQAEGSLDFYTDDGESLDGEDGRPPITVRFSHQHGVWHLWTESVVSFVLHSPITPKQVFRNGEPVQGTAWQAI